MVTGVTSVSPAFLSPSFDDEALEASLEEAVCAADEA
jgi:hypothetical protein